MDRIEEIKTILKFAKWLGEENYLNFIGRDYSVTNIDPSMAVEEYMESKNE